MSDCIQTKGIERFQGMFAGPRGYRPRGPEKLQAKLLSLSMLCKRKSYACGLALCHKHRYFQGNETETHFTWDLSHLLLLLCSFVCITEEKCGKTVCFSPDTPSHVGQFHSANIRNIGKAVSCWGWSKKIFVLSQDWLPSQAPVLTLG